MGKKSRKGKGKKRLETEIAQTRSQVNRNAKRQRKKQQRDKEEEEYLKEWAAFERQVALLGLRIIDMASDGNCMYRALSDQIEGRPGHHKRIRGEVVEFMRENHDEFAPFIVGEFDRYCNKMARDAQWGGNLELTAASRKYQIDIIVHQYNQPRYEILYQFGSPVKAIHLSYHNNDHYASVRLLTDPGKGIPHTIILGSREQSAAREETRAVLAANLAYGTDADMSTSAIGDDLILAEDPTDHELAVMEASGCSDLVRVREALEWNENDYQASVDFLVLQMNELNLEQSLSSSTTANRGQNDERKTDEVEEPREEPSRKNKNKCPCGSRKKYKKCCGKLKRKRKSREEEDDESRASAIPTNLSPQEQTLVRLSQEVENISNKKRKKKLQQQIARLKDDIAQSKRAKEEKSKGEPPPPPVDHGSITI